MKKEDARYTDPFPYVVGDGADDEVAIELPGSDIMPTYGMVRRAKGEAAKMRERQVQDESATMEQVDRVMQELPLIGEGGIVVGTVSQTDTQSASKEDEERTRTIRAVERFFERFEEAGGDMKMYGSRYPGADWPMDYHQAPQSRPHPYKPEIRDRYATLLTQMMTGIAFIGMNRVVATIHIHSN